MIDTERKQKNEMTASLLVSRDSVWQMGNVIRDLKNRLETIKGEYPDLSLDAEIERAEKCLKKHAPDTIRYAPHPFRWRGDWEVEP